MSFAVASFVNEISLRRQREMALIRCAIPLKALGFAIISSPTKIGAIRPCLSAKIEPELGQSLLGGR